jgi:Tat protein secretion system quality control protein TatD with DNase activity
MSVILHLRDEEYGNAYLKGYDILMRNSAKVQKVHIHCFAGSAEAVIMWNQRFYFGLTALMRNIGTGQSEAVQRILWDHILLETDSPYFRGCFIQHPQRLQFLLHHFKPYCVEADINAISNGDTLCCTLCKFTHWVSKDNNFLLFLFCNFFLINKIASRFLCVNQNKNEI